MTLKNDDLHLIRLLEFSPFERRERGGWRFGTKVIRDPIIERLIASGRAASDGATVWLVKNGAAA
jgi:hypothetical protein